VIRSAVGRVAGADAPAEFRRRRTGRPHDTKLESAAAAYQESMTDTDGDDAERPGASTPGPDGADDDRTEGTFLVTAAEASSAVLRNVETGQVHTLSSNPGVERGEVVEGAVAPDPPLEVSYQLIETESRRSVPIERSPEPPTAHSVDLAADQAVGDLTREPRAGTGEVHVLTVPEDGTDEAVADVLDDDEQLRARAARLGVDRVEIRSAPGVVSVRYLP
jgi:hypothetical protein